MGLLDNFLKKKTVTTTKLITEPTATFSSYTGDAYANDIYRGAVDAIARNAGKLKGRHLVANGQEDYNLNMLLQTRPNPYMSAYDLFYKLVTHLFLENNAFAFLDKDERGNLIGIYPVTYTGLNILSDKNNKLYCSFTLKNGNKTILPYENLIHLRRFFNDNEILGADNAAIMPGLELAQTQNEGIINGIKSGANIRGILHFTQIMGDTQLKEAQKSFVEDYLSMQNGTGVIATDQKTEYTPIKNDPVILNADQAKEIKIKIYDYLGITEEIVSSNYNEDQYSAFYESTLEPIATALSQEFTSKLFTEKEQKYGNSIVFESGRLQFTSNKTKVDLITKLVPLGLLTINQALEILNLPGVKDGDKRLQALNMIDQKQAEAYQEKEGKK